MQSFAASFGFQSESAAKAEVHKHSLPLDPLPRAYILKLGFIPTPYMATALWR